MVDLQAIVFLTFTLSHLKFKLLLFRVMKN